jgi:hypothetical protein
MTDAPGKYPRIEFENQREMIEKAIRLAIESPPRQGANLMVPPGFEAATVARQLRGALTSHCCQPLVAFFEADAVPNPSAFVQELFDQWRKVAELGVVSYGSNLKLRPPTRDNASHENLKQLLDSLTGIDRPVVIVFDRFHKILGSLDEWVLAQLRTAEEDQLLCTITITPLHYQHLKQRWRKDHPLTVSDFGRKHARLAAQVGSATTLGARWRELGVPEHLATFALAVTGGYPEPLNALLDEWRRRHGTANLEPAIKMAYRDIAEQAVERLIDWLDVQPENSLNREAVLNLYQGVDVDRAIDQLNGHPYEELLLCNGELRAECVGGAAVRMAGQSLKDVRAMALRQYARRQYAVAEQLLKPTGDKPRRLADCILRSHARIMAVLYDEEGTENRLDSEWRRLVDAIAIARTQLAAYRALIREDYYFLIEERYRMLEELAQAVIRTIGPKGGQKARIVDVLAGLYDHRASTEDHLNAFRLIVRHVEVARALPGSTHACLVAIALPEQLFRIWAFIRLGVNYYKVPPADEATWQQAEHAWRTLEKCAMKRPEPGTEFGSLAALAYYAMARHSVLYPSQLADALEDSFESLQKNLARYGEVRRALAHSMTIVRKPDRDRYFQVIDQWLDRAVASCCPSHSRRELQAICDPLPLLDDQGNLI